MNNTLVCKPLIDSHPSRRRASLWKSLQDGFGHHRVDKPQQCNDDDAEFNYWLKFGFIVLCCLAVLK